MHKRSSVPLRTNAIVTRIEAKHGQASRPVGKRSLQILRQMGSRCAGDGLFAAFDGPARAIRCACRIRDEVRTLGLEVSSALRAGECEVVGDKIGGIAVHIGARVAVAAEPGEVLVSSTVKDLVAGSGIAYKERGEHVLRGLPGK
jgi:class 3 adenylate cyclase